MKLGGIMRGESIYLPAIAQVYTKAVQIISSLSSRLSMTSWELVTFIVKQSRLLE